MDYALNYTANLLYTNQSDEDGNFKPEESAKHLAGETNFFQYSNFLYGCAPGDFDDEPICQPCNSKSEDIPESHDGDLNRKRFPKCDECQKDCRTPNPIMLKKIKSVANSIKER